MFGLISIAYEIPNEAIEAMNTRSLKPCADAGAGSLKIQREA